MVWLFLLLNRSQSVPVICVMLISWFGMDIDAVCHGCLTDVTSLFVACRMLILYGIANLIAAGWFVGNMVGSDSPSRSVGLKISFN